MSGKARRLLRCPIRHESSYDIRQGTQAPTITGRARRCLQYLVGHKGSYDVRQGMRALTMFGRAQRLLLYPVGHNGSYDNRLGTMALTTTTVVLIYKTFIHQSHDHLIYLLIHHTNRIMPSPRCISHVQQYYDHLIQILNQSLLISWCHTQYIFHPSIINQDHLQFISLYHQQ